MIFLDREEAGQKLAEKLRGYANREDVLVLGIPRGGVAVAYQVALGLHAPLDIFILRKLGVPGDEELAFGAIASGGVRLLDWGIIKALAISDAEIESITRQERVELTRRELAYRGDRPPANVARRTVILVDDGIATGSSMRAGITALRQLQPARIVVAVPVAPVRICNQLRNEVDELVCVYMPQSFQAIGQFYVNFSQVSDEEVVDWLNPAQRLVTQETI